MTNVESGGQRASGEKKEVQIYVKICEIGGIDTIKEYFTGEFLIEARWHEPVLLTSYDPSSNWTPMLYIENALDDSEDILSERTQYELTQSPSNGTTLVLERRIVKGKFWNKLELSNFPFDIQELGITVASEYDKNAVTLVADPVRASRMSTSVTYTFQAQQQWFVFFLISSILNETFQKSGLRLISFLGLVFCG